MVRESEHQGRGGEHQGKAARCELSQPAPPFERQMKHLLLTAIAAVVLVGCGNPEADRALFTAVQVESIQAVEQAIAAGADVNAKDDSNITPLLWAINNSHKEIVELLITKGADVNAKTDGGQTPLDSANREDKTETADLLRKHGGKTAEELKAEGE